MSNETTPGTSPTESLTPPKRGRKIVAGAAFVLATAGAAVGLTGHSDGSAARETAPVEKVATDRGTPVEATQTAEISGVDPALQAAAHEAQAKQLQEAVAAQQAAAVAAEQAAANTEQAETTEIVDPSQEVGIGEGGMAAEKNPDGTIEVGPNNNGEQVLPNNP